MKNSKGRHSRRMTNPVETLLAVLIACMSILVVVLLCAIGIKLFDEKEQQPDFVQQPTSAEVETQLPSVTENTDSQEETTQPDDRLPYLLEEGKLEITSLFQYTGLNPDAYL